MNLTKLLHLIDVALAEKGTGKTRNLGRASTLSLCALIWWNVKDLPDNMRDLTTRVAVIEARMNVTHQAGVTPAASRSTNWFSYLPK